MRLNIWQNGQVIDSRDLADGTYKIGRAPESDIRLKSTQVSKQHGLLIIKGDKAAIVDLGSSNGIFVNGILVRKQRITSKDDIAIVDFKLKVGESERPIGMASLQLDAPHQAPFQGNLATDFARFEQSSPDSPPAVPISPQERFLTLVDRVILMPFYSIVKTADWRWLLSSILLIALVSSVILSVIPIVRWGKRITTEEAVNRAHTVISQAVRENYRLLTKTSDYSRLTVEVPENEKGMLAVYIIDPKTKTILAPAKVFNKALTDVWSLAAIERVTRDNEEKVSIRQSESIHVLAQPIYMYSAETKQNNIVAIIVAHFQISDEITSTFQPLVEASLFAILLSLIAFFFIFKMITYPIATMNDQLDAALKGGDVTVTCEAKFPELENLATVLNFTLSRLKKGGGAAPGKITSEDTEEEDLSYIKAVKEFNEGSTDAILLLDIEKKVRFVGTALEELVGMKNQYAEGQNVSDACKDPGLAGTAIDLTDNVIGNIGQTQYATLDINGITRDLVAVGHKNSAGELRFVLIIIKLEK